MLQATVGRQHVFCLLVDSEFIPAEKEKRAN